MIMDAKRDGSASELLPDPSFPLQVKDSASKEVKEASMAEQPLRGRMGRPKFNPTAPHTVYMCSLGIFDRLFR